MARMLALMGLVSCDLLETPEYPDDDFSIVGTWEYQIPPLPENLIPVLSEGSLYNATGWVTFTEDSCFSFTIESDQGNIHSYGTYEVDMDQGVTLKYDSYSIIDDFAYSHDYTNVSYGSFGSAISWGVEGDEVTSDYIKIHDSNTRFIVEYRRVSPQSYKPVITNYISNDGPYKYRLVDHRGQSCISLSIPIEQLLNLMDNEME